jgi:hypothetical protein
MRVNNIKHWVVKTLRLFLGEKHLLKMRLQRNFKYYNKHNIIFIHIPKNAGSSISFALYGRSLGHWRADELVKFDSKSYSRFKSIAVLRDPIERSYSAWNYCRSSGTGDGWVKDRPEYHIPEFQTFESFATKWLPSRDPKNLDFVFQTQSSFVCDTEGNVLVSELALLSRLPEVWQGLISLSGAKSATLPERNVNFNKCRSGKFKISQSARDAIETIYADDFRLIERVET